MNFSLMGCIGPLSATVRVAAPLKVSLLECLLCCHFVSVRDRQGRGPIEGVFRVPPYPLCGVSVRDRQGRGPIEGRVPF